MAELLDQFVCVRAVEMEGVDLSLFQFDYDQTWTVFFLNADRTFYGRYGTRASQSADAGVDVSVAGLERAAEAALAVHAGYPTNKATLAGKRGTPPHANEIRQFPGFKARFVGDPPKNCCHCHHVWEALRSVPREAGKPLPDELFHPYPKPDRVGLSLELDQCATVKSVAAGSAAEKAGFRPGDRISTFDRQPMLSIADVQWVLHHAKAPCDVLAEVERGGAKEELMLHLAADWRGGEDVTWRASTWPMRPFGWQEATDDQRAALGVKPGALCVRVRNVPKSGVAQAAGIQAGDFVVEIDGSAKAIDENEWLRYVQQVKKQGQAIQLTVVHKGTRSKAKLEAP